MPETCGRSRRWRVLARAMAVLFALRALVPVGFMPDLAALEDGRLEIVLCTADGQRAALAGGNGQPADDRHPAGPSAADCPFSSVATKALALPAVADQAPSPTGGDRVSFVARTIDDTTPVRGPPLGSRAPPARLA